MLKRLQNECRQDGRLEHTLEDAGYHFSETGPMELSGGFGIAFGTNTVTECGIAAFCHVLFKAHPRFILVADFLAVHAGGKDSFKSLYTRL